MLCRLAARPTQNRDVTSFFLAVLTAARAPRACAACSTIEPAVRTYPKCERCRVVYYCNAACQRTHWPTHKLECQALADKAEAEKRGVFASMSQGR